MRWSQDFKENHTLKRYWKVGGITGGILETIVEQIQPIMQYLFVVYQYSNFVVLKSWWDELFLSSSFESLLSGVALVKQG